ncbi:hypothetical protein [uncultured Cellulomonas sp.]|uniref:hypothetical protein n=1 Tax=uncultured Cellulomonas sp. TaxID=189682 RepID=UPI0028F00EBA|nr:hypothetical protein [uncultured Cellulomonas sp.]
MRYRQITKGTATAAGLLVVAVLLGACTQPEPTPSPTPSVSTATPTSTVSPTSSVDPTIAAAEAAILEAYQGYWSAKVAAWADPTKDPGPELLTYAVDTALTDVQASVLQFRQDGIAVTGRPVLAPRVSNVVPGEAGTAAIVDCVDASTWTPIFTATGESALAPGYSARVLTNSTAYFYDGRWTIRTSVVDRDKPC